MRLFRIAAFMIMFTLVMSLFVGKATEFCLAAVSLPGELVRAGDFSVVISDVQREKDTTVLYFAITKVADTKSKPQAVPVILVDDHGNEYRGELTIDAGVSDLSEAGDILLALPEGYTYVQVLKIHIPQAAPITKVRLRDKEFDFARVKLAEPRYLTDYGKFALTKGQPVEVGRWLVFGMNRIEPKIRHWELIVEVANKDYNPLPAAAKLGVQETDGTISWSSRHLVDVPGQGLAEAKVALPITGWKDGAPFQPRSLLLQFQDRKTGEHALRLYRMTAGELPPLVGQGPKEIEDKFIEAYQRNGGREVIGDPVNLPHWLAGGDQPKDVNDLLVQEFHGFINPSAIVWDKQAAAPEAYSIQLDIWRTYKSLGGPYFTSKVDNSVLGAPTSGPIVVHPKDSLFGTGGHYSVFKGGAIAWGGKRPAVVVVMGKMFEKWKEKVFLKGVLGSPISEARPAPPSGAQGFNTTGWVQDFEGGHILCVSSGKHAGKVFEVHGPIAELYMKGMQGSTGWLGFPSGDQYRNPKGFPGANFEGGFIATADGTRWELFPYEAAKIAFVSDRDGNQEIYIMDTSGENEINLTRNLANDYSPTWSPDGTKIAFVSDREGSPALYLMKSDGSNVTRVCQTSSEGGQLSWFPNRATIAFNSGSGTGNVISIVDVDGKNLQHLARHSGFNAGGPTVSPRGEQIAYMLGTIRGGTLRVTDVAGKALREFAFFFRGAPFNPSWSPDGKWIAFFGLPKKDGIYLVDPNSGSVIQLTKAGCNPSWSADGQWIVFDSGRGGNLQIVQSDGKISRNVLEGGDNRWDPSWGTP